MNGQITTVCHAMMRDDRISCHQLGHVYQNVLVLNIDVPVKLDI
jgi:hypothetical protein